MLGDNAIFKMAEMIKKISSYKPQAVLIPEVKKLIQALAALTDFDIEINELNVDLFISKLENKNLAAYLTAITRMTVSPNIIPDSCEADIDIRALSGQNKDYVINELGRVLDADEIEITQYTAPTVSISNTDFYRLISNTLQKFVGNDLILPSISSGGTDPRLLRKVGIPSYGIAMLTLNLDPNLRESVHGKDERIDIDSLKLKTDFLVSLAKRYLGF